MHEGRKFQFWVGSIRYSGIILEETLTHWLVDELREGKILIPKTAVAKEVSE